MFLLILLKYIYFIGGIITLLMHHYYYIIKSKIAFYATCQKQKCHNLTIVREQNCLEYCVL
jgi:hypothetical protein